MTTIAVISAFLAGFLYLAYAGLLLRYKHLHATSMSLIDRFDDYARAEGDAIEKIIVQMYEEGRLGELDADAAALLIRRRELDRAILRTHDAARASQTGSVANNTKSS